MKTLKVKLSCRLSLLALLWFDRCYPSRTDSNSPTRPNNFFPFGTDEGDSIVTTGSGNCYGPISIPYDVFNHKTIYVSMSLLFIPVFRFSIMFIS